MATITVATAAPAPVAVPIPEIAPPPKFSGEKGQVVRFINACCLFMQMRTDQVGDTSRISWVLSYIQGEIAVKGCKRELHTGTNKTMICQLLITY